MNREAEEMVEMKSSHYPLPPEEAEQGFHPFVTEESSDPTSSEGKNLDDQTSHRIVLQLNSNLNWYCSVPTELNRTELEISYFGVRLNCFRAVTAVRSVWLLPVTLWITYSFDYG